jgi:aminodeoxyfutalosine deaminase
VRKFAATYLFTGRGELVKNSILICENDGTIVDVEHRDKPFREAAGIEYYSGILVPGFVNTHCHLEFSHLYKKISEKSGLAGFIGQINQLRNASEVERTKAMQVADRRMWGSGIAAVGDVSNSATSLKTKQKSKINYHTFVEAFGFHPSRAERAFKHAENLQAKFLEYNLSASIVPHSAYSVSDPLFSKIGEWAKQNKSILSVHNQESRAEQDFVEKGSGPIAHHIQKNLELDITQWKATGESALHRILDYLPEENRLLLVHNTFTNRKDLEYLAKKHDLEETYFVLCPNSNLFIEDAIPPISLFQKYGLNICLGTDSLASNHQLSILHEMITLHEHFNELNLEDLLTWASINGARALGMENEIGTFEPGKKPGVNIISGLDLKKLKFTSNSKVKRLL